MAALPIAVVLALASSHAPQVAPETIAGFAEGESALDPLAIRDNFSGHMFAPRSLDGAIRLAYALMREGHHLDLGLLQISDRNLPRLGLTVSSAFDEVVSIKAGARVLVENYQQCLLTLQGEAALTCMASYYNSGHPTGDDPYVARIWRVADQIVPAIRDARQLHLPLPNAPPPSQESDEFYDAVTVHAPRPLQPQQDHK